MIVLPRSVARVALRQSRINTLLFAAPKRLSSTYHSYSLPSTSPTPPSNDDIPETSLSHPEPLPRVHETRPPAIPAHHQQALDHQKQQKQSAAHVEKPTAPPVAVAEPPKTKAKTPRPRPKLRARKAAMTLTPSAVEQLRSLLDQPEPKLIKVGVKNRGCSGLSYHLEYVEKPGAFDETVEQDGVKVLIDSKALFSIIGSEMDWAEDKLNQRFVFRNPNIKEECGCGESFMV